MSTTILTDEQIVGFAYKRDGQPEITLMRLFARDVEQAVLQSPEVQALRRLAKALEEKIESYERYGPICEFEGEPMIHATHLEELRAAMEKQP